MALARVFCRRGNRTGCMLWKKCTIDVINYY